MNKSGDLPVGPRVPGPNATLQHVVGMILPSPRAIDCRRASHSACQAGTRLTIMAPYRAYTPGGCGPYIISVLLGTIGAINSPHYVNGLGASTN